MKNRIRQLRKEKGITQIRLSIELGVSQETISAYEKGKYNPSVKNLMKLSEIFDADIDYILGKSSQRAKRQEFESTESVGLINSQRMLKRAQKFEQYITEIQERKILSLYRSMNRLQKEKTVAYMQGLLDNEEREEFEKEKEE